MKRIAIHGVPRSGTTWLGAIFDSSPGTAFRNQPFFSYAFKNFLSEDSDSERIKDFFQQLLFSEDEYVNQIQEKKRGIIPVFDKSEISHLVYKETRYHYLLSTLLKNDPELKLIGIIRNPKSVIYSWINAPKEFDKENWSLSEEWQLASLKNKGREEEYFGFNKWLEYVSLMHKLLQEYPNRVKIVKYADLLRNNENTIKDLFKFVDLDFSEQTKAFITNEMKMENQDPYSVFRAKQSDQKWKGNLPDSIIGEIEAKLIGTEFEIYLK